MACFTGYFIIFKDFRSIWTLLVGQSSVFIDNALRKIEMLMVYVLVEYWLTAISKNIKRKVKIE